MRRYLTVFIILFLFGFSLFLFYQTRNDLVISPNGLNLTVPEAQSPDKTNDPNPLPPPSDIEPQKPLANPPNVIKAVYLTSWSAANKTKMDYIIDLLKTTELNAVVIDIKDFSGYVAYDIKNAEVEKYKAKDIRIPKLNSLIKRLHDENIYVIGRITIFQDPILAKARSDLAIKSLSTNEIWYDNKKLAWVDPAAKEVWDYNIAIAKDAASRGFDELNFDYIRFPSDGNLNDMSFPFWDQKTSKPNVIRNFFKYLRSELKDIKISADLFGLTTIDVNDLGIGQVIENAYIYFDFVSPMLYPSHYFTGLFGYKNPALHPYEVVKQSMDSALKRLREYGLKPTTSSTASSTVTSTIELKNESSQLKAKLRPWLQDFNLGATYNAEMVSKEIQAVYDAAITTPELINGFMLWNPSNIYTKEALKPE